MSRKIFLLAAAAVLLLTGCSAAAPAETSEIPQEETAAQSAGIADGVFTDSDKEFQVAVPAGWREDPALSDRDRTVLLSPGGESSVELRKQSPDPNLLAYDKTDFEESYREKYEAFRLKTFSSVKGQGNKGVYLEFTCRKNKLTYTVYQAVFAGDYDYNIAYSTVSADKQFAAMAKKNLETFREIDPLNDAGVLPGRLDGRNYLSAEGTYSLTLPKNWRVTKQEAESVLFADKTGRYNINLMIGAKDKKLFSYKKSYFTDYFKETLDSSVALKKLETVTAGKNKARYLECAYSYDGQNLYAKQYLINSGKHTYTLTLTAPAALKDKVDFSAVANSFSAKATS